MKRLLEIMKSRIEPYIGIGIIIVVVVLQLTDVKDELTVEITANRGEIKANKEAWKADDAADEIINKQRLDQIQAIGEELKVEQRILKGNINGLRIAATHGAEERHAQLEGRLIVFQRQMVNMSISQEAYFDTLRAIQRELDSIRALRPVAETVIVIEADTIPAKKVRRFWFDG